jgi:superfamily II DNA or RNA helicase
MASSTSEREWIQRRGRVLRKSPGKTKATLHDFICIPPYEYRSECKSVFTRELKRALEFSESSDNRFERNGGRMVLERLRSEYGL